MGKLDTNKKVKEDSLLNTAFSLFTTKGVSKTSISDIVAAGEQRWCGERNVLSLFQGQI